LFEYLRIRLKPRATVIPAQAGIQSGQTILEGFVFLLDSRLRGNDVSNAGSNFETGPKLDIATLLGK
jgi:hypothetical protein